MPRSTWLNILIILLVIIAAAYVAQLALSFVSGFADIIVLLLLSWLVAYALNPLVDGLIGRAVFLPLVHGVDRLNERGVFAPLGRTLNRLNKRVNLAPLVNAIGPYRSKELRQRLTEYRVERPLAVMLVYLGVLVLVVVAIASLIPAILSQVNLIVPQLSNIDILESTLTTLFQDVLIRLNIEYNIQNLIDSAFTSLQSLATPILQNTVAILTSVLSLLGNVLLVILLSFFFALDGPRFTTMLYDVMPERLHQETRMFLVTTDRAFGGFLRSQVLQAGAIGVGTGMILSMFGIQAPLLSGAFAGLFMLIPLLGPVLSLLPPLLATLLTEPNRILVMIPIVILQVVVVNVMMPRIVGNALGLHPLVILISLLIGVKFGGFWGAFFAMPLAGIISAFGAFLIRRRQRLAELTASIVRDDPAEASVPPLDTSLLVEPHTEMINPSDIVQKRSHA